MSEPIGILIPEGGIGLVYDTKTREVRAYCGGDYPLESWNIELVDGQGNTITITRKKAFK